MKLERTRAVFCSNITPNQFCVFGAFSGQIGEFKLGKIPERSNFDISQLCIAQTPRTCCRAQQGDSGQKLRVASEQTRGRRRPDQSAADQVLSHQRTVRGFPVCTSRPASNLRGYQLAVANSNANPNTSSNTISEPLCNNFDKVRKKDFLNPELAISREKKKPVT